MRWERVEKPSDLYKIGDMVDVKVTEIDDKGRLNLSRREVLIKVDGLTPEDSGDDKSQRPRRPRGNNDRRRNGGRR